MAVAVAKAVEDGASGDRLRVDREHRRLGRRVRGARRPDRASCSCPAGRDRGGEAGAVARGRRAASLEVRGSFDEALASCLELAERGAFVLVNSLNPHRIEGQKTAAFEIVEELGRAPDVLALPYGGGGNTRRVRQGLRRGGRARRGSSPPRRPSARRRWRRRSGSPSRRTSTRSTTSSPTAASRSSPSPTRRSPTRGSSSRASRASSASRRRPPGFAALAARRARAGQHRRLRPHRPRPEGHRRRRAC